MGDEHLEIRVLGLPLDLHRRASEHHAALEREFALLAATEPGVTTVPARLLALSTELRERFAGMSDDAHEQLAAALAAGDAETVELTYRLPPEAGEAAAQLDALLDEADEFCREGDHLVTLAAPAEVAAYRRWFLGEFVTQAAGGAPRPWDPARAERVRLPDELDLETAPELRVRLLDRIAGGDVELRLDGARVSFIDSVGVSVLMAAHARCAAEGGRVVIEGASPRLRQTLQSVGVADVLLGGGDASEAPPA